MKCEGQASTSLLFPMYVVVKSTWWLPTTAETCSRWQLHVQRYKICVRTDRQWLTNKTGWRYQKKKIQNLVATATGSPWFVNSCIHEHHNITWYNTVWEHQEKPSNNLEVT